MTLDYLEGLSWPNLKSLELEVDLQLYGAPLKSMLHDGLEHVELSGFQSGGSQYFGDTILPTLFVSTASPVRRPTLTREESLQEPQEYTYWT